MADIVNLGVQTKLPVPVEKVLAGAATKHEAQPFKYVIVIAVYENGEEYFAASEADASLNNWYADRFKFHLQKIAD